MSYSKYAYGGLSMYFVERMKYSEKASCRMTNTVLCVCGMTKVCVHRVRYSESFVRGLAERLRGAYEIQWKNNEMYVRCTMNGFVERMKYSGKTTGNTYDAR